MNVDDFDLLAADDTKVDILRALSLPTALPHGKDVAIPRELGRRIFCIHSCRAKVRQTTFDLRLFAKI